MMRILTILNENGLSMNIRNTDELMPGFNFSDDNTIVVLDWNCDDTKSFLNSLKLWEFPSFKWIIIDDWKGIERDENALLMALEKQNLGVSSEVYHILGTSNETYIINQGKKFVIQ